MLLKYNSVLPEVLSVRLFFAEDEDSSHSESTVATIVDAFIAHIAQTVEHFLGKEEVTGSSPVMGSI